MNSNKNQNRQQKAIKNLPILTLLLIATSTNQAQIENCIKQYQGISEFSGCENCKESFYLQETTKNHFICSPCAPGCKDCSTYSDCLECQDTYFFNQLTDKCSPCTEGCQRCNQINDCEACLPTFFLYQRSEDNSVVCNRCTDNCSQCYNPRFCITCSDGFYEMSGKCVKCPEFCTKCRSSEECFSCVEGYEVDGVCKKIPLWKKIQASFFMILSIFVIALVVFIAISYCHDGVYRAVHRRRGKDEDDYEYEPARYDAKKLEELELV